MSRFLERLLIGGLALTSAVCAAQPARFEGVGRTATAAEIQAWDIDVRPDFKGLPKGQGSVKRGEQVWEAQCASCHGTFGESNDVFTPIVGFTSKKDNEAGNVASLQLGANAPTRTTMMKVAHLSTLWDYINRAMPWTAPKTLSADEVYAVTAYILNLASVVPDDFTLTDRNIREVQDRLPNRRGLTTAHGLWPGTELGGKPRPDAQGSNCMRDCKTDVRVASLIPDYARNAHGNLAEQSRGLGPTRGADTAGVAKPEAKVASAAPVPAPAAGGVTTTEVMPLLQKSVCIACHGVDTKLVGPSFKDIAAKYQGRADAQSYLAGKIRAGGQGVWGAIPMPVQSIGEADAQRVAQWLAVGSVK
jgi:S-disulfanyl-L-cysteine oxidoreductase SoxD